MARLRTGVRNWRRQTFKPRTTWNFQVGRQTAFFGGGTDWEKSKRSEETQTFDSLNICRKARADAEMSIIDREPARSVWWKVVRFLKRELTGYSKYSGVFKILCEMGRQISRTTFLLNFYCKLFCKLLMEICLLTFYQAIRYSYLPFRSCIWCQIDMQTFGAR